MSLLFLAQQTTTTVVAINKGAGLAQLFIFLAAGIVLAIGGIALALQRDWGHMPHLFVGVAIATAALSAVNWMTNANITPTNPLGCLWMMVS